MTMPVQKPVPYELIGSSRLVRDCAAEVDRAAGDDRNVLITAERGFDVERIARGVHARSGRASGPFVVAASEGAFADLERGLFGTAQRGGAAAATGPESLSSTSALYRANGGVMFVPNIGELPAALQRRLARVLRDAEVRVSRRAEPITLDVRVLGSTETGPDGGLRDDLARRLPVVIEVPALRQRREDVPAIAEAMLASQGLEHQFTPAALIVLAALPWRRNTAELAGLIERLAKANGDTLIRQEDVLAEVQLDRAPVRAGNLREARRQFEREYIASVLRDYEWQMPEAARALGIERANLYRKARQLGIPLRRDSESGASRVTR
jgi:DNA-binding NtrC family response regulator